jgi:DNA-binding Lrp family transcriptional regulator
MKLTLKDKKILSILDLHARDSFQAIAKKVQLSKETVIYRVRRLERAGIIVRYATLVNFGKLGYTGYALYARFVHADEEKKKEIVAYLKDIPELYWIALVGGKFDIVFGVMCKSSYHYNRIYYMILNKFSNYFSDLTVAIRIELRQNPKSFDLPVSQKLFTPPFFGKEPELFQLDTLDEDILSALSNDARMSVVELSKKINAPASTIRLRIKNLEKEEIIQGYMTCIKPDLYGKQSYRLFLFLQNIDEATRNKLFAHVFENKNMVRGIETLGTWNFEITLEIYSHEELQKELNDLRNIFMDVIYNIEFVITFEEDLVYDLYPLQKKLS